jgi:hypothetical protein
MTQDLIPHIQFIGIAFLLLGFVHIIFPKYFNWKIDLAALSLINRQMMVVHTFFIALVVVLMGLLCIFCADELTQTTLGKKISGGLAIFWGIRMFIQFFGYSSKLWKGKAFETTVHILFSLFWMYITSVFILNTWT